MKKRSVIYSAIIVGLMVIGFMLGFVLSGGIGNKKPEQGGITAGLDGQADTEEEELGDYAFVSSGLDMPLADAVEENAEKITPSTKMVYEYYYMGDGNVEKTEEIPPYFLIDMTKKDVEDAFVDWEVLSFDSSEVVMRKNVEGKSDQYYVVGVHKGYIAVFYENEVNGTTLKEITDMPVSVFDESEQERLREGIHVSGKTELIRILQDYGS